ncbi:hypothetical protein [Allokutzneria multivorans]
MNSLLPSLEVISDPAVRARLHERLDPAWQRGNPGVAPCPQRRLV